jgi:hypothetical protein
LAVEYFERCSAMRRLVRPVQQGRR